jgi:hypothetical protein
MFSSETFMGEDCDNNEGEVDSFFFFIAPNVLQFYIDN